MKSADRCHLHLLLSNMDCEAVGKSDFPQNDSEKEIFKLLCSIWLDNAAHTRVSNMHVMTGSHNKVFKFSLNRGVKALDRLVMSSLQESCGWSGEICF